MPNAELIIRKGREKSLYKRHPWLFSGAIEEVIGEPQPGEMVSLKARNGESLGQGFYNPNSQIAVRMLSFGASRFDQTLLKERLQRAIAFRKTLLPHTQAQRLVHGEADGLPGLVVDQYHDLLVLQFSSLGMSLLKAELLALLPALLEPFAPVRLIVERSESPALKEEGMEPFKGVLWGEGPSQTEVLENDVKFAVDVLEGQKTGFFIDQRDNRALIGQLAAGKKLLNCFSYTGGFSLYAALKGAQTTSIEISAAAQALAQQNFQLNGLDPTAHEFVTANVFDSLRELPPEFDVIILDPPAFVKNKQHLKKACRAYQDINRLAMRQSKPDGLLLTCSCSHYMDSELFQKIIFSAALEAGREVQLLQRLGHPIDHPVALSHPEGEYLKAFLLRVL